MISANSIEVANTDASQAMVAPEKIRRATQGKEALVFTNIYEEENNIVVWQRELSNTLKQSVSDFLLSKPKFQTTMTVTPKDALSSISEALGADENVSELSENVAELVDMFACLFALDRVGLRLSVLQSAMCPKFHIDRIPCRLITTYQGSATEWLQHQDVERSKLGRGSNGLPDNQSGLYKNDSEIQQLSTGDVALLKGELWIGNEEAGLVHRSPAVLPNENRLLLTLDFSD